MRESIGTVSLLNFIIFFILLVFAFIMATFSYYKAFRVNNAIVSAIEKYEGFNSYSQKEIKDKLGGLGYEFIDFDCRNNNKNVELLDINGKITKNASTRGYEGYCVYVKNRDVLSTDNDIDRYDSYEVTTIISVNFPGLDGVLKLRVNSKTNRIYNFECAASAMENDGTCSMPYDPVKGVS